jgi:hypothetical protein
MREATILEIVQGATDTLISVDRPTALVGSSNDDSRLFLELVRQSANVIAASYKWPQLLRRHTITLVDGQAAYALPDDYDYRISGTEWDIANQWTLIGPLTDQEWELESNGITASGPRKKFTVRGRGDNQFLLDPVPSASEAGDTITFVYASLSTFRPKRWTANTNFSAGSYCSYNGNFYVSTSGGTTGSTPPTHASGSASDGGITWDYTTTPYDKPTADTDVPLFDADVMQLSVQWRWLRSHEMQYQDTLSEFSLMLESQQSATRGTRTLSLNRRRGNQFISRNNLPETGYG